MGPGWDAAKIAETKNLTQDTLSLDTPVGDEGDTQYGDFIPDESRESPFEAASAVLMGESIARLLGRLAEREAWVLKMRYGLIDGHEHTLEDVGQQLGVTRERIRQIESKALRKLKYHQSRDRSLHDYLRD